MTEPIKPPDLSTDKGFDRDAFSALCTTTVTVSGGGAAHGRAWGRARSDDGVLDLDLRMRSSSSPPVPRPASTLTGDVSVITLPTLAPGPRDPAAA